MSLSQSLETQEREKAIITWERKAARESGFCRREGSRLLPTDPMRRPPQQDLQTGQGRVENRPRVLCTLLLMASSAPLQMLITQPFPLKAASRHLQDQPGWRGQPAPSSQRLCLSPRGSMIYPPVLCHPRERARGRNRMGSDCCELSHFSDPVRSSQPSGHHRSICVSMMHGGQPATGSCEMRQAL